MNVFKEVFRGQWRSGEDTWGADIARHGPLLRTAIYLHMSGSVKYQRVGTPADEVKDGGAGDHCATTPPLPGCRASPWYLGLLTASCYALTYFWRYPIFVLPAHTLATPVASVFGRELNFQQ